MKKFTVLLTEIDERANVITMHIEAAEPKSAAVVAAEEYHNETYQDWELAFDFDSYVIVAVYPGHIESLYNEIG